MTQTVTRIAPDWLTAAQTRAVMKALAPARPLFVGGCVRDALMGRASEDIDIAVVSPPDQTMALAEGAGLRAIGTGVEHGVVTVIVDGAPFEVATLRRDVATDGRRAVVAFTDRIEDDAARRDFTLNALYANAGGDVLDPLGEGLADLEARRIRFIGDARLRLREDYLRILRFFRFHAQFGISPLDKAGLAACLAERGGLEAISAERIGAEMKKMLSAPDPGAAVLGMGPILTDILPDAHWPSGLIAAEAGWRLPPEPMRRIAALEAASLDRLRLSKAETAQVEAINRCKDLSLNEAVYRHGAKAAIDGLVVSGAPYSDQTRDIKRAQEAVFPVTAADLMDRGVAKGPKLGAALKRLEADWIAAGFTLSKSDLLARL